MLPLCAVGFLRHWKVWLRGNHSRDRSNNSQLLTSGEVQNIAIKRQCEPKGDPGAWGTDPLPAAGPCSPVYMKLSSLLCFCECTQHSKPAACMVTPMWDRICRQKLFGVSAVPLTAHFSRGSCTHGQGCCCLECERANLTIMKQLRLKTTSKIILFQPPCHAMGRAASHHDQGAQDPIQPGCKHLQGWEPNGQGSFY